MTDPKETHEQMEKRLKLEVATRHIADVIKDTLPEGVTFMLFLANVGKGNIAYAGDTQRESAVEILKEHLNHWGANQ